LCLVFYFAWKGSEKEKEKEQEDIFVYLEDLGFRVKN